MFLTIKKYSKYSNIVHYNITFKRNALTLYLKECSNDVIFALKMA